MSNDDIFRNVKLPKLDIPSFNYEMPDLTETNNTIQRSIKALRDQQEKEERYKEDFLQTLRNIESNTVGLKEIIPILSKNNENNEQIINLLKEILEIASSQNVEEAESKWRQIMKKATTVTEDVETIQKLQGFANTVLTLFQNLNV